MLTAWFGTWTMMALMRMSASMRFCTVEAHPLQVIPWTVNAMSATQSLRYLLLTRTVSLLQSQPWHEHRHSFTSVVTVD